MTIQSSRLRPSFHIFQYKNHDQIFILKNNQFVAISIIISNRGKQHLNNCFMSTLNHSESLDNLNKLQEKPGEIRIVD